jgi:hypothetical protein
LIRFLRIEEIDDMAATAEQESKKLGAATRALGMKVGAAARERARDLSPLYNGN